MSRIHHEKTRIEAAQASGGVMARATKSSASGLGITSWSKKCCQAVDCGTLVSSKVSRIARAPLGGSCGLRLSRAPRGGWKHQADVAGFDSPARKYESARQEGIALGAFARRVLRPNFPVTRPVSFEQERIYGKALTLRRAQGGDIVLSSG
jgi:hypothetical protein